MRVMMRWIVNYIYEHKEQWIVDKEIRQSENAGEILLKEQKLNESVKYDKNRNESENE